MPDTDRRPRAPEGFWVIWSTVAMDQIVFAMVLPALPFVARRYGASPLQVTALVAVFALSQFLISPFAGALSDRVGRKPILIVSLFGSAVGSLILGLAGTLPLLFLGRAVDGLSGTALVSAQAAMTDMVEPKRRARYLGLMGTAFAVGFVVGPALTAVASIANDRLPFFIAAGLGVVNGVVAIFRLPETRPESDRLALIESHAIGNDERSPFGFLRHAEVLNSATWFYIGVLTLGMVAFGAIDGGAFTLLADDRLGFDQSSIAAVFVWVGIVLATVQASVVGPLNARLGPRLSVVASFAFNAVGFILLAGMDTAWLLVFAVSLNSVGQAVLRPTCTSAVSNSVDSQYRGMAIGTQTSAQGLARIVGPLLAGALYSAISPGAAFVCAAVLVAVGAIVVANVGRRWDHAVL